MVGCSEPFAAITEIVDVVERGEAASTPQPMHSPNPSPAAIPADARCKPRRLFRPKQQSTNASADPGKDAFELRGRAALAVGAVTVSVVEANEPDGVRVAGANLHAAPAGSPEQRNETAEVKPFCGITKAVVVPLRPEVTVSAAGESATVKVGAAKPIV